MSKKFAIASETFIASQWTGLEYHTAIDNPIFQELTERCLDRCIGQLLTTAIEIESFTITSIPILGYDGKITSVVVAATMIASLKTMTINTKVSNE